MSRWIAHAMSCIGCAIVGFVAGAMVGGASYSANVETDVGRFELDSMQFKALSRQLKGLERSADSRLDRAIAELRRSASMLNAPPAGPAPVSRPEPRAADPQLHASELGGGALDALESLSQWEADPEVRSRWMLASEASLVEAIGRPSSVVHRDDAEWWTYRIDSDRSLVVTLNRGRVVGVTRVRDS